MATKGVLLKKAEKAATTVIIVNLNELNFS